MEKRLDGSLAVRYSERYKPGEAVRSGGPAESPPVKAAKQQRGRRRGGDWNQNLDFKKAPKSGKYAGVGLQRGGSLLMDSRITATTWKKWREGKFAL